MSDAAASDRPELTRSDYDRLIALLRAARPTEEKESATTCRELDRDSHGISLRLDQMQHAMDRRFDHVEQATSARFDDVQRGINGRYDLMQRIFIGAAFLTIACVGYLFVATTQTSIAMGRVESRFDAVDKRLDAMDERIDKRFEQIDRRLDNIVDLVGQLRPIRQQGIVDQQ